MATVNSQLSFFEREKLLRVALDALLALRSGTSRGRKLTDRWLDETIAVLQQLRISARANDQITVGRAKLEQRLTEPFPGKCSVEMRLEIADGTIFRSVRVTGDPSGDISRRAVLCLDEILGERQ